MDNPSPQAQSSRKVGVGLWAGIALAPYIFSWFTLRSGYSKATRTGAFIWMAIAIAIVSSNHNKLHTSSKNAMNQQTALSPSSSTNSLAPISAPHSVVGIWDCNVANPDGSNSHSRLVLHPGGKMDLLSIDQPEMSQYGDFSLNGNNMTLHFTNIPYLERLGRSPSVNIVTAAELNQITDTHLNLTVHSKHTRVFDCANAASAQSGAPATLPSSTGAQSNAEQNATTNTQATSDPAPQPVQSSTGDDLFGPYSGLSSLDDSIKDIARGMIMSMPQGGACYNTYKPMIMRILSQNAPTEVLREQLGSIASDVAGCQH